ncbi:MAG: hypothetical protein IK037_04260 [Clostridia bacterium]|nr:hypothetical protein [Clostridia bacterium]MBR5987762.1 hypothetical protein [Clostridia bacterium]
MKKKNAKLLSWATTIFAAACGIVAFCMIFVISIKTPGYLAKESFTGLQVALGCSINDHTIFNASAGLILAYLFPLVGACASVIGKGNKIVTLISGALLVTGGALALSTLSLLNPTVYFFTLSDPTLAAGPIASGVLALVGGVTLFGSVFLKD